MNWAGSNRRQRLPGDWNTRRHHVLTRDPTCQINGPTCTVVSTEADHIINNDNHQLENLQGACHPCHAAKTRAEAEAARHRERRPPEPHPGLH